LTQLNIGSLFKENNDLKEAIDYFLEENDNEKSLPLDQQLKKLNSITYNHIEWYLDSSGIVDPKKVKVFRLEKSKFLNRSLVFEKLKLKKQSSHQIVKRFGLFTMKTSEFCSPKETLKLVEQKNEMYNENQDLITKVNDMKKILDDYKDEVAKNLIPSISTSPIPETKTRSSFSYENTTEVYQPFKNTLTLRGHIDSVSALVFDEKNERLISSSVNIKIWDLVSGKCLHTFYNVHNDSINALKLSSDGKILISGSNDGTIKILSLVEDDWYNNAYTLNEDKNTDRILSLVYYEPVNIIAGTHLGEIYVYYFEEDIEMKTIRGHEDAVYDLVLDENSNRLISASGDSTIKFWDLKTWENIGTFKAHQNSVLKLIFNQETGCLFSFSKNSNNNEIKSWNLGKERNSLQSVILNEFNFTSNGTFNFGLNSQKQILTFPYNQPAKVWEYQTGANINKFYLNVYDNSKVSELIITKKDKLIIGYENGIIRVWE
jgi:WD40 repeat protein